VTAYRRRIDRRTFLDRSLGLGAAMLAPAIVRAQASKPAMPCGIGAGDVNGGRAIIWSRTDRPARLVVEYSTTESFRDPRRVIGPAALEPTDFTARVALRELPAGQRIFYRVRFQDLTDLTASSDPLTGSFLTPPSDASRDLTIAWSADTVGQGWGINPAWGGLRLYDAMRRAQPDVFVHCGDTIYADGPLETEVKLDDGTVWKNTVTEAKSHAAESLADFRGCHQYNLTDEHMRRFNAEVAQMPLWDDHEVRDNWYPTRDLSKDDRYKLKSMALIAERARRAFLEHHPIAIDPDNQDRIHRTVSLGPAVEIFGLDLRSYRGPNSENKQTTLDESSALMGASQLAWLKERLAASRATWKVMRERSPDRTRRAGSTELLRSLRERRSRCRRWGASWRLPICCALSRRAACATWCGSLADVHYCAAHHYDPARAKFTDFDPFWELVAGPLHAGTFGPNTLDPTFGPEARFVGIPPA
jgi:alkaline phosphatase D